MIDRRYNLVLKNRRDVGYVEYVCDIHRRPTIQYGTGFYHKLGDGSSCDSPHFIFDREKISRDAIMQNAWRRK